MDRLISKFFKLGTAEEKQEHVLDVDTSQKILEEAKPSAEQSQQPPFDDKHEREISNELNSINFF